MLSARSGRPCVCRPVPQGGAKTVRFSRTAVQITPDCNTETQESRKVKKLRSLLTMRRFSGL